MATKEMVKIVQTVEVPEGEEGNRSDSATFHNWTTVADTKNNRRALRAALLEAGEVRISLQVEATATGRDHLNATERNALINRIQASFRSHPMFKGLDKISGEVRKENKRLWYFVRMIGAPNEHWELAEFIANGGTVADPMEPVARGRKPKK